MGKYRRIKPCDCGWSFTTLRKQRCEPSAWTLLDIYYFTLQILCSHVTALHNLFPLVFLCNSISFILSYFSAGPCPACLRPNSNNSLTIWTRQPCNTTNTFLSYQHYSSSFNEKSNNSFITGLPSDLIQRTRCSVESCIKMNKGRCQKKKRDYVRKIPKWWTPHPQFGKPQL